MKLSTDDDREFLLWNDKREIEEKYNDFIKAMESFGFSKQDSYVEKLAERFTYEQDDILWCDSIENIGCERDGLQMTVAILRSGQAVISNSKSAVWLDDDEVALVAKALTSK